MVAGKPLNEGRPTAGEEKLESSNKKHRTEAPSYVFLELFAGSAGLTSAVKKVGIRCEAPQDLAQGGVDFTKRDQVEELWQHYKKLAGDGAQLVVHVAPPCSTFSRARDRSAATRCRSWSAPEGLNELSATTIQKVREGNEITDNTLATVKLLIELGAAITWEQPAGP